jgi:FMN phosphatase YigB (HAD superfamily)
VYQVLAGTYGEDSVVSQRWRANFPKLLFQGGLTVEEVADVLHNPQDIEDFIEMYMTGLTARPGFQKALDIFEQNGVDFYAASNGSRERLQSYFGKANITIRDDQILKPDKAPYLHMLKQHEGKYDTVIFQGESTSRRY